MKIWEKFSEDQLKEILQTSFSYKEALSKIGYSTYSHNNKIIREISTKYNIDISHFNNGQENLVGHRFNKLVVIAEDLEEEKRRKEKGEVGKKSKRYWQCQCDCGNIVSVTTSHLKSGNTQSCGCLQKQRTAEALRINLEGQRFGKLTVLKPSENIVEPSGQIRTAWECQCDCGQKCIVKTINLQAGDTKSCGCIVSQGEEKIAELLKEMNISFKREYTFKDLLTDKNFPMRFDFAIFNNQKLECLIEYQGRQHYMEWDTKIQTTLEERQKRDNKKRKYCLNNNIKLIEIPYWDFDKIDKNYIKEKIYECNYR